MPGKKYRLRYLPIFYEDLDEKVTYIADTLKNPQAANELLDKVDSAILERLPIAESFEPYHSIRERKYNYYRIYVDNFTIYYVVINDNPNDPIMEIRPFLYNGQNQRRLICAQSVSEKQKKRGTSHVEMSEVRKGIQEYKPESLLRREA